MTGLLNSYLDAGFTPPTVELYPVAGAPNPLLGDQNSIKGKYTSSTTGLNASGYGGMYDGGYNNGALLARGARLNHTDPKMLLYGYWSTIVNRRLSCTVEYALYKLSNPTGAIGSSNTATLVPETVLSVTFNKVGNDANYIGRGYCPLPAPVELPLGTYVLVRTSPEGSGADLDLYSYNTAAGLPSGAGWAILGMVDPTPMWDASSDVSTQGPYWEHTIMLPYDPRPPVALNFYTAGKNALSLAGGTAVSSVSATVTLNQDITGNRAVLIPIASISGAHRTITGVTLGGVPGTVRTISPDGSAAAGVIGFWPASSGLTAGPHTLTVTFSQTTTNTLSARAPVYELDNVNQDPSAHVFSHIRDTTGVSALRAAVGVPDKYFDGFFGSCMGNTVAAPTYLSATGGVMARYGEFGCNDTDVLPPFYSGPIPATPTEWGLFYVMSGTTGAHTFPFALLSRA